MKPKPFACLIVSMIGLYAVFSAVLVAGMPLLLLVVSAVAPGQSVEPAGYAALVCIPQCLLPLGLGVFLLRKAETVADWVMKWSGIQPGDDVLPKWEAGFDGLAFSLLGVFMLATTVPGVLQDFAAWFQAMAAETRYLSGISSTGYWRNRFPTVVYHAAAIGISLYVFLRGKSIAAIVASIRRAGAERGAASEPPNKSPEATPGQRLPESPGPSSGAPQL